MESKELKALRESKGLTQAATAKLLGITLRHYQRLERDHGLTAPMAKLIELTLGKL